MREILFRGKRLDNGKLLIGNSIMQCDNYLGTGKAVLLWDDENGWIKVDPETVGQFTGLYDKNGTPIFEGDVLFHPEGASSYKTPPKHFEVVFTHGIFGADRGWFGLLPDEMENCEAIGNIHDNPELLEET